MLAVVLGVLIMGLTLSNDAQVHADEPAMQQLPFDDLPEEIKKKILEKIKEYTNGEEADSDAVPIPTLAVALPDLQPDQARLQEGEVLRVIDVLVGGREERVRYYGIDTPERGERCYDEASERNEALVGEAVLLLPDARERDPFDRLLRYIFTEGGVSVEARLIAEGLGTAWREDGAYRDELLALEAEARTADAGCLWE